MRGGGQVCRRGLETLANTHRIQTDCFPSLCRFQTGHFVVVKMAIIEGWLSQYKGSMVAYDILSATCVL